MIRARGHAVSSSNSAASHNVAKLMAPRITLIPAASSPSVVRATRSATNPLPHKGEPGIQSVPNARAQRRTTNRTWRLSL